MEISLHVDIMRCHSCGHEILLLSRKVTYPKQLSTSQPFLRCVRCGSDDIVRLVPRTPTITISDDEIERMSDVLENGMQCAKCGVKMPLLSGLRADLVFEREEHIDDIEGLTKKWTEAVPFCTRCMEQESEAVLIEAALLYFDKSGKSVMRDVLERSRKKWKK